jgi:ABC-2 type transport system ATP-binding protein
LFFQDGEQAAIDTEAVAKEQTTVVRTAREGSALKLWSVQPEETLYGLFGFTKERGYRVEQVSIHEMSLEDVFIAFTGKEWRD